MVGPFDQVAYHADPGAQIFDEGFEALTGCRTEDLLPIAIWQERWGDRRRGVEDSQALHQLCQVLVGASIWLLRTQVRVVPHYLQRRAQDLIRLLDIIHTQEALAEAGRLAGKQVGPLQA